MSELTIEEMGNRLQLKDIKVVNEILKYAEKYWAQELMVKKNLEEKSQKFFMMSSAGLTLMCTLGTYLTHIYSPIPWPKVFSAAFICSGLCFLTAAGLFFAAGRIATYFVLSENSILSKGAIEQTLLPEGSVREYRRHMARHLIDIGMKGNVNNEKKAGLIIAGEWAFFSALVFTMINMSFFIIAILKN